MKLFRKNRRGFRPEQEALAGQIAGGIIRVQLRIATYLNGKTRHFSRRRKLRCLLLFCLLFAAINGWLLIQSLTH